MDARIIITDASVTIERFSSATGRVDPLPLTAAPQNAYAAAPAPRYPEMVAADAASGAIDAGPAPPAASGPTEGAPARFVTGSLGATTPGSYNGADLGAAVPAGSAPGFDGQP